MISAATAIAFLGAPAADQTLLEDIIERATATLQRAVGFYLGPVAERQVIRDGSMYGKPPLMEIVLVDDVLTPTVDNPIVVEQLTADWEWEALEPTNWRRDGRRFYYRGGWPCGSRSLRFTYQSGWADDAGPADLRDLVLRLVALRYRDAQSDGVASEKLSDYSYALQDNAKIASDWDAAVRAHRRTFPI